MAVRAALQQEQRRLPPAGGVLREEEACRSMAGERGVGHGIGAAGAVDEAGAAGRLDVDGEEVVEAVRPRLDDRHAVAARLRHVLAPLAAKVRPQCLLRPGQVDEPRARRLHGRGRPPAVGAQPARKRIPGRDGGVDHDVAQAHPPRGRAEGVGPRGHATRAEAGRDRPARGITDRPRTRAKPVHEELGAGRAVGCVHDDAFRRPAVRRLHLRPGRLLGVRAARRTGHEGVPRRVVGTQAERRVVGGRPIVRHASVARRRVADRARASEPASSGRCSSRL